MALFVVRRFGLALERDARQASVLRLVLIVIPHHVDDVEIVDVLRDRRRTLLMGADGLTLTHLGQRNVAPPVRPGSDPSEAKSWFPVVDPEDGPIGFLPSVLTAERSERGPDGIVLLDANRSLAAEQVR